MVVFLDLDEDVPDDPHADPGQLSGFPSIRRLPVREPRTSSDLQDEQGVEAVERDNPNLNVVSEALGCYPIISLITSHIDLNTLHALSRTCRQIRSNILQYRTRLAQSTLRCENEPANTAPLPARHPSTPKWHILGEAGHLVSGGKPASTCARDLVGDCRRCGRIICRNCTIKPPSSVRLPARHRRLCPTCLKAPLALLTRSGPSCGGSSAFTIPSTVTGGGVKAGGTTNGTDLAFVTRGSACTCAQAIHLCTPCGAKLATADTTYRRVWTWRTRYTTYLGGLGTGIGEGNEGVKCARGKECLGAKDVEVEFECPTTSNNDIGASSGSGSGSTSSDASDGGENQPVTTGLGAGSAAGETSRSGTPVGIGIDIGIGTGVHRSRSRSRSKEEAAGYWRQEIEGLGGVVKKKFRKRERVGRTVREWEDEREGRTEILWREKDGSVRSWCGWCGRVVLGRKDVENLNQGQ